MSDAELRTLIKGAPNKVLIKDKDGKDHELCPLDLSDLIEYEDKIGVSLLTKERDFKLRDLAYLLYLSLRKEGLSPEEVDKRKYKLSENSIYRFFDLRVIKNSAEIVSDLMRISGLDVPREEQEKSPLVEQASLGQN